MHMHSNRTNSNPFIVQCTTATPNPLPKALYEEVRDFRDRVSLDHLKECVDYSHASWISFFIDIGGIDLLSSILRENLAIISIEKTGVDASDAQATVVTCLTCLRAITDRPGGLPRLAANRHAVRTVVSILGTGAKGAKHLAIELLSRLVQLDPKSYRTVLKALVGRSSVGGGGGCGGSVAESGKGTGVGGATTSRMNPVRHVVSMQ